MRTYCDARRECPQDRRSTPCVLSEDHDGEHVWQCRTECCVLAEDHPGEHDGPGMVTHLTAPCVYREGDRIRHTDGTGYSDLVTDAEIIEHHTVYLDGLDIPEDIAEFRGKAAFCRAVLALRQVERAQADFEAALRWLE